MNTKRQQHGFTMIELIVVIVILGVLAAVALPRMTGMQRDARVAKLNAAKGAVSAAAGMVHGAAMARQGQLQPNCAGFGVPNLLANGDGSICTENGLVQVLRLYPSPDFNGVIAAAGLVQVNAVPTQAQLRVEGYDVVVNPGQRVTFQVTGGVNQATCFFTYDLPTQVGRAPVISATNVNGC